MTTCVGIKVAHAEIKSPFKLRGFLLSQDSRLVCISPTGMATDRGNSITRRYCLRLFSLHPKPTATSLGIPLPSRAGKSWGQKVLSAFDRKLFLYALVQALVVAGIHINPMAVECAPPAP